MKTLIIKYLPSGAESNTLKFLDLFLKEVAGKTEIETVDLLKNPAPIFDEKAMAAYYKRNYGGKELVGDEASALKAQDALKKQLLAADILVMAYPMHNFGMPAAAKAWLDAVIMKGETFDYGKKMMAGKKALTLFTSGGRYNHEAFDLQYPNWDTVTLLAKINFGFMGFDEAQVIGDSLRDEAQDRLSKAKGQIAEVVGKWY